MRRNGVISASRRGGLFFATRNACSFHLQKFANQPNFTGSSGFVRGGDRVRTAMTHVAPYHMVEEKGLECSVVCC